MAVCLKCNSQLAEGAGFCPNCGAPAGTGSAESKKGLPIFGLLFGGCGCVVLISIAIGVVILLAVLLSSAQKPAQEGVPSAPQAPQVAEEPVLKKGEVLIRFAKGMTEDARLVDVTTKFSSNDPQIVQMIDWGPDTFEPGTKLIWGWYYNVETFVYASYYIVKEGKVGVYDIVKRPEKGFQPGEYTAIVMINETPITGFTFSVE